LGVILSVIRIGSWPVIVSFLLVVGIYWLSFHITLPLTLRYIVESVLPGQIGAFGGLNDTTYITLLTTIAGTTGVFLALYFTTLSIVATTYSEPHHREIRNLIIENRVSRGYLFILAHLGTTCLFGLAFLAVGFPPSLLLMVYLLLIAAIVIFSFFILGRHIFQFLDPRFLASTPTKKFLKSVRNATVLGARWKLPSFQNHFKKQALGDLYKLECLVEFALSQSARREIVRDLCIQLLRLLNTNVSYSCKIPSLSMWFPRKRVYREWGFTSGIQTDFALRSGNLPQPEEVPNYLFVCEAISRMIRRSVEGLLSQQDYSELSEVLMEIHRVSGKLGECLAIEEAQHLLTKVREVLFSDSNGLSVIETKDRVQAMSIAGIYGTCFLNLAISASQNLELRPAEAILSTWIDLKPARMKRLYSGSHPREVLRHLEDFRQCLLFERKTEGRVQSTARFQKEHIARRYADYIWGMSERLVLFINEHHVQPVRRLMKANAKWTTAELLRSSIETTKKIGFRIAELGDLHKKLLADAVTKEDWKSTDYDGLRKKLDVIEGELLLNVAQIAPSLTVGMDVGETPDYAGTFRAYLGDALVSKMQSQDVTHFESLFTGHFKTTLGVAQRHITRKDDHLLRSHRNVALDTALDLLDLSGLSFLFSELHGSSFYETVKKEWDDYFGAHSDGKLAIEFFYLAISMDLQLPISSPSATGRWRWERAFVAVMARAGFNIERLHSRWEGEEDVRTKHTSPIIQSIYPHMGTMFHRPYEYFVAFYLSERPEAEGVELHYNAKQCKEEVDQESRRRQGGTNP